MATAGLNWEETELAGGGALRCAGPATARAAVLFAGGGTSRPLAGTWSSGYEWLLPRLLPQLPELRCGWLRYETRSWARLAGPVRDHRQALDRLLADGPERVVLVGFSMGGAVALTNAREPAITGLLGLAPWFPPSLSLDPLRGKRLRVLHGTLDGRIPGVPGVAPETSQAAVARAQELGIDATWRPIPGGHHAWAIRPFGQLIAVPPADLWLREIRASLQELLEQ